ncbi:DnaD domain-containing protein [Natronobacillus azotifigens]|uniref:DnaD domain-containing protein n=1 Tax=Natronobacillus azotifigens TaxID=472978 RepID=UPI00300E56A9
MSELTQEDQYQNFLMDQITIPSKLLSDYHKHNIAEKEMIVILQIHRFSLLGVYFPTPDEIAATVSFDGQECSTILRKLLQRNMLKIIETNDEQSMVGERYSLEPLWVKLYQDSTDKQEQSSNESMNIFLLFEQEFGRTLSPFEIENINMWIDEEEQEPALIKAALREAVLMSKLNFKYIDRILREWKRKGIRSVGQAREHSKAFHDRQSQQSNRGQTEQKRDHSIYYNWLEDE